MVRALDKAEPDAMVTLSSALNNIGSNLPLNHLFACTQHGAIGLRECVTELSVRYFRNYNNYVENGNLLKKIKVKSSRFYTFGRHIVPSIYHGKRSELR